MRKLGILLAVVLLLFSFGYDVFSVTSTNKNITVRVLGSWDPFSMGWEPDELLISPTNVLNKPYGAIVDQNDLTNNGGRMLTYFGNPYRNTCEPTNDSTYPGRDTDTLTKAELSELWLTWDTNALYVAVRGQTAGRHNNLMIYFDREPGVGRTSFNENPPIVWQRGVFFKDMDPDMYIGFWNPNDSVKFDINPDKSGGGVQIYSHTGPDGSVKVGMSSYADTANVPGSPNMDTSIFDFWFNGEYESDMFKRVVIAKIAWSFFFTNVNPTNMWLKVAVATTGPDSGNYNYEYMPDSSTPVNPSFKSVEDNFVMIRVTDGNANPIIGVSVRNNAYVNFYPGVKLEVSKTPKFYMKVTRATSSTEDDRPKVLAPAKGDKLSIRIGIESATDFFVQGSIKILDMKGNVVRNLAQNINLSANMVSSPSDLVVKPGVYQFPYTFVWDGTDDKGQKVPMGNYIIVVSGRNISGLDMIGTRLVSVIY